MRTSGRSANAPRDAAHDAVGGTQPAGDLPATDGRDDVTEPEVGAVAEAVAASAQSLEEPGGEAGAEGAQARDSDFVQSLDRGLAVIRAFGPDRERLSLSEVARATGLTRAAARRFLLTLVKLGYVRNDGREFSLRPRVLELGYAYLSGLALPEVAMPHLEELSATLHESSSVSVLDGQAIVYIARVPTKRIMTIAISVGTRFPAFATSMGRVLMAGMSDEELDAFVADANLEAYTRYTVTDPGELKRIVREVGEQGYAIIDQELEEGLRALAAPIRDAAGAVVAAVNVSAHASRVTPDDMRAELLPGLLEAARQIEADLKSLGKG